MNILAFDIETVVGEPFALQFGGLHGAELFQVDRSTILETWFRYLASHSDPDQLNLLWAHHLEFDITATFIEHPEIWDTTRAYLRGEVDAVGRVEATFHHAKNPFHQILVQGYRWLLLDTGSFFKGRLGKICRTLKLRRKLPPPSYLGQRAPTFEEWSYFEEYACNDALCAWELGCYIVEQHRELGIPLTLSIAHMAGTLLRVRSLGDDLSHPSRTRAHSLWPEVQRAKKSRLVTGCLHIPIAPPIPLPPGDWVNASLSSFHGGKNGLYVAPGVYDGVTEADITSAYPCAMRQLPPLTKGRYEETRTIVPGRCAIYRVVGRVRDRCPYGVFMDVDGRAITHGTFDTWVTGYELEAGLAEVVIDSISGLYWEPHPDAVNPFASHVDFLFEGKQRAKPDDPQREVFKLLLNSSYGKLAQVVVKEDPMIGQTRVQTGNLFNPFWASQTTGYCRAQLHRYEHRFRALHSSTDSILTQAPPDRVPTGDGLGDLKIVRTGLLIVLRTKLYVHLGHDGRVKTARGGFHGKSADLLALIRRGGGSYIYEHMVRPREARRSRSGEKPLRMVSRVAHVHGIVPDVWAAAAAGLDEWPHDVLVDDSPDDDAD